MSNLNYLKNILFEILIFNFKDFLIIFNKLLFYLNFNIIYFKYGIKGYFYEK